MVTKALLIAAITALGAGAAAAKDAAQTPTGEDVLSTLDKAHPRLILKDGRLNELKKLVETDPLARKIAQDAIAEADACCERRPLVYRKIGPRLLHVSRDCLNRTYALALAWRLTGKELYARKARENLLAVCEFPDWNPSHFLDTAEMSHAVGIGYDWLFSWLDAASREKIKAALIKLGLQPGLAVYEQKGWWSRSTYNWNQVCNGGMMIGALAIAETDAQYARRIVPAALASLPLALASYAPDGAWPEGPGYWNYATSYTVFALAALETAMGRDFGLSNMEALPVTGLFPLYGTGPTGLYLNFADSGEYNQRRPIPCLFWLSARYRLPVLAEAEHAALARRGAGPLHLVWYVPPPAAKPPALQLDKHFRGPVELAVFRSAWNEDALFAGIKAGYNQVNHAHLDLGNFEIDALGVRWARDIGSDDYNLPAYWSGGRGGKRWTYYRLGSLSHNLLLLDDANQDPMGTSRIVKFESRPDSAFAIVDLTKAYPQAARVTRGLAMVQARRSVLVQDELEIDKPCQVAWGMTTDARISLDKEKPQATLTLKGKRLRCEILSPAGAAFTAESAGQKPPQETNEGVSRLMLRLNHRKGSLRIAVLLSPVWPDGKTDQPPKPSPLSEW